MEIAALVTVFGWAFFSFWTSIPGGVALGAAPIAVVVTAVLSYAAGAALVALVGGVIRDRVLARIAPQPDAQPSRMMRIIRSTWDRFGLVGLGLLAPLTVGSQIGAAVGLSFGARPVPLVIALTGGAAVWGVVLGIAVALGVQAVGG